MSNKFDTLRVGTCSNLLIIEQEMSLLHILTYKYR
jgi:hypothetical protein